MKRVLVLALLALLLPAAANAEFCTIDNVPAATLLLPYFEVDLDDANGVDTLFTIQNVNSAAVLTHVIVWTDLSVEALDFNVYLTGFDMQSISMGLILRDGILPVTASAGQDPIDLISPQGALSDDYNYASCTGILPYGVPELDETFLEDHLQPILTGGPSAVYEGRCGGIDHGDNIARGYVTIDTVFNCTLLRPCDPGYLNGTVSKQNYLLGSWFMVYSGQNFAQGDAMVAIEAVGEGGAPGVTGFYGRCFGNTPGPDGREALPSVHSTPYFENVAFTGGTDLFVWRDSRVPHTEGFSCALDFNSPPFPLGQEQVIIFDEEENPVIPDPCEVSPCPDPEENAFFPWEAQRVPIRNIQVPFDSGWLYLDLDFNGSYGQSWVETIMDADGRYSVGIPAGHLSNPCPQ